MEIKSKLKATRLVSRLTWLNIKIGYLHTKMAYLKALIFINERRNAFKMFAVDFAEMVAFAILIIIIIILI